MNVAMLIGPKFGKHNIWHACFYVQVQTKIMMNVIKYIQANVNNG